MKTNRGHAIFPTIHVRNTGAPEKKKTSPAKIPSMGNRENLGTIPEYVAAAIKWELASKPIKTVSLEFSLSYAAVYRINNGISHLHVKPAPKTSEVESWLAQREN